eukprot:TRINITY_DN2189_c1_g1_i1.p1 TRINITY_DN2189_c1_g1~~TRINITY_DN2189_c1_g1_i1.p1  ORF type:complete len:506 (-),score=224.32 TRINITY_DN2189_c1_g1_i1:128-1645(-)
MADYPAIKNQFQSLRTTFYSQRTKPAKYRCQQLRAFYKLVDENEKLITDAIFKDLHKNTAEACFTELEMVKNEICLCLEKLDSWMAPVKVEVDAFMAFDGAQIIHEPLGVILIIGAWNYPIQVTLLPLVAVIASGNCAIIKPSDLSVHTSQVIFDLIPRYLDNNSYQVILGGVPETTALLELPFDHIVYTGSGAVGKIVMKKAAENLCPVTLELGGKSPCIVDDLSKSKMETAGRRIAWGKFMNAGQICIAPDYILCTEESEQKLINSIIKAVHEYYGESVIDSPNYGRIINDRHFQRVSNLLNSGEIAFGGQTDREQKYIAPTILRNVSPDSPIMQEEIFGPILPIVRVKSVQEAINFVNTRDKPLAMYIFTEHKRFWQQIIGSTSSGGASINDTLMQVAAPSLPFGGVGPSGMGAYHGKNGFERFSHKRSMVVKALALEFANTVRYPPFPNWKVKLSKVLIYNRKPNKSIWSYARLSFKLLIVAYVLYNLSAALLDYFKYFKN